MPELPEVENVRLSLESKMRFKTVVSCKVENSKLIKLPDNHMDFQKNIRGLTFIKFKRKGKYLIIGMDDDYTLVIHLGMTGLFIYVNDLAEIPDKYKKHIHITLKLNEGYACYCDIRKFGSLRLLNKEQFKNFKPIQHLGPEPFDDNALEEFKINLSKNKWKHKEIKLAIMNQNVIAGVGNIYASEALYNAKINPNTEVSKLSEDQINLLFKEIKDVLEESIKLGGSSISDYMNGEGKTGQFQNYLKVYGQKNCPNNHPIVEQVIGERNTFYCPICQK